MLVRSSNLCFLKRRSTPRAQRSLRMRWGMKKKCARNQVPQIFTVLLSGDLSKQILNIRCFKNKTQSYLNFIPGFPVVRYKLPHCSVPSKITGKQEKLQLLVSEKSLELSSTYFAGNSQINEISCNKCWKKRQQFHDCFYMQKKPTCRFVFWLHRGMTE